MITEDIYTALADKLQYPRSEWLLRVLQKLVTPDEGQMLLDIPGESIDLAQKWEMDELAVDAKLQEFQERGLAVKTRKGVMFDRDIIQLHDSTLSSAEKWIDDELLALWKDFYENEWFETMGQAYANSPEKSVIVLPAIQAIERSPGITEENLMPEENVRELIRQADVLSVVPCTCRRSLKRCDLPVEVCLQFNKGAEHAIARNSGKKLSVDEAIAIADKAEEAGLIHTWPFFSMGHVREICNCCSDCCMLFNPGLKHGTLDKALKKSRFRAIMDPEKCSGCEICVERCSLGAIEMVPGDLVAKVDVDKCYGCGVCVVGCDFGALSLRIAQS